MRELKLQARAKLVPVNARKEQRESRREAKAEKAAQITNAIEKELLARLQAGVYANSGMDYIPARQYKRVMDVVAEKNRELQDEERVAEDEAADEEAVEDEEEIEYEPAEYSEEEELDDSQSGYREVVEGDFESDDLEDTDLNLSAAGGSVFNIGGDDEDEQQLGQDHNVFAEATSSSASAPRNNKSTKQQKPSAAATRPASNQQQQRRNTKTDRKDQRPAMEIEYEYEREMASTHEVDR